MLKLTNKHRLFVETYEGDVLTAMRIAGFEGTDKKLTTEGNALLQDALIIQAIQERSKYLASTMKAIATRTERQAWWTSIMRNEDPNAKPEINDKGVTQPVGNIPLPVRIKASELLGKSETDFIERMDVNHQLSISDVIKEAYSISNDDLPAIEAEYERLYAHKKKGIQEDFPVEEQTDNEEQEGPTRLESFI